MYYEQKSHSSINLSPWPGSEEAIIDEDAEKRGDLIVAVINEIRRDKSERRLPLNRPIKRLTVYAGEKDSSKTILEGKGDISGTCKVDYFEIKLQKGEGRKVNPYEKVSFVAEY
jgi:valyl-tRNA synthetase